MLYLLGEQDPNGPFRVNRDEIELLKDEGKDITLVTYTNGVHLLDGIDFWPDVAQWLSSGMIFWTSDKFRRELNAYNLIKRCSGLGTFID